MKKVWALLIGLVGFCAPVHAEWVDASKGLAEADILFVAVPAGGGPGLYAASARRVFRSNEAGEWKQVLSLRGAETRIHCLWVDRSGAVFVGSDKGLQKSLDSGKKWGWVYQHSGEKGIVLAVFEDPSDERFLWVGTRLGPVRVSKDGREKEAVPFPAAAVHSFTAASGLLFASADDGIYRSADAGKNWEKAIFEARPEPREGGDALAQFSIEEIAPVGHSFVVASPKGGYLASTPSGFYEANADALSWTRLEEPVPSRNVRHLASSGGLVYAATDRGLYRWDGQSSQGLNEGLPSTDVHMAHFDAYSGDLYAATRKGVYRYPKPELSVSVKTEPPEMKDVLGRFEHEPAIREVQEAAIRYAEVHPDKINAWRRAASRKAFFPALSIGTDRGEDLNVDIDRGGTGDPDKFIIGPKEQTTDWHVDLSWDLSEIIWNGDQTSIDTRSKLMVELRGDILNEVTHLYFERRRLQTEILLAPPKELPLRIEKELKLQELTADIDAMTGGFLTDNASIR
jgi:hypothetical protein